VRALSLPEKFDAETGKFVPLDKGYSEERDPDYTLPETDVETDVSEEDDDKDELEVLVKEALEELPEELKDGKHKMRKVVSPVKVTLTPSKEGNEDPQEEILTLDSEEEEPAKERPPALWVRELLLTEQPEEYDSGEDPEFVPPPVIYETDREYDEYSDGGDKIPDDEVKSLLSDEKTTLAPPSTYIPIWIPVNSPAEKIARAKEQLEELGGGDDQEASKSETSGKDTDSNGKKIDEAVSATKPVPKPLPDAGTGLTPAMRKMKVDRTSSEDGEGGEVPKPKRERKKSKAKSVEEEKPDGNASAVANAPTKQGDKSTVEDVAKVPEADKTSPKTPVKIDVKVKAAGDVASSKDVVEATTSGVAPAKSSGKDTKTPEKNKIDDKAKAGDIAAPKGGVEAAMGVAAAKSPGKEVIKAKTPEKGKKSPMKKAEVSKESPEKTAK